MVSSEEINQKLRDKRTKKNSEGYLICDKCNGYYQLQKDESPDDFDKCECGGKLSFLKDNKNDISEKNFKTNFNDSSNPNIKKMETTKDIRGLIKALNNNSNVYIRRNAAIALGNLGNLKASDALKKALNDHDRLVRTHSVNAINKISVNELPLKLEDNTVNTEHKTSKSIGISNWWKNHSVRNKRILIGLITIIIISSVAYAVFSPKVTPLSINSPISLDNNEIGKYSFDNFSTSDSIVHVVGKTSPNATVKVYITYGNTFYDENNIDGSTLIANKSIPAEIRNYYAEEDPGSDNYDKGRLITPVIDKNTGEFDFDVPLNHYFGHVWIYIVANAPGFEKNMLELIVNIPTSSQKTIISESTGEPSNFTTTPNQRAQGTSEDYDEGYDEGYYNGINDAFTKSKFDNKLSKSGNVTEMWISGYKKGYKEGYEDIKNGRPLQKPRVPGRGITDPRTGKNIYS